mmetsp:Transcript_26475/g.72782  ORF Transcript_26475/g.72782 Transcript_26475/m.72782 type:complete len:251 (+) Transcript_26475:457-1209(+)
MELSTLRSAARRVRNGSHEREPAGGPVRERQRASTERGSGGPPKAPEERTAPRSTRARSAAKRCHCQGRPLFGILRVLGITIAFSFRRVVFVIVATVIVVIVGRHCFSHRGGEPAPVPPVEHSGLYVSPGRAQSTHRHGRNDSLHLRHGFGRFGPQRDPLEGHGAVLRDGYQHVLRAQAKGDPLVTVLAGRGIAAARLSLSEGLGTRRHAHADCHPQKGLEVRGSGALQQSVGPLRAGGGFHHQPPEHCW